MAVAAEDCRVSTDNTTGVVSLVTTPYEHLTDTIDHMISYDHIRKKISHLFKDV